MLTRTFSTRITHFFSNMLPILVMMGLLNKLSTCSYLPGLKTLRGPFSNPSNRTSSASCPSGYILESCYCSRADCVGAVIAGNTCSVETSGNTLQAVLDCRYFGENLPRITDIKTAFFPEIGTATCPNNKIAVLCTSHRSLENNFGKGTIIDASSCQVRKCNNTCEITIRCLDAPTIRCFISELFSRYKTDGWILDGVIGQKISNLLYDELRGALAIPACSKHTSSKSPPSIYVESKNVVLFVARIPIYGSQNASSMSIQRELEECIFVMFSFYHQNIARFANILQIEDSTGKKHSPISIQLYLDNCCQQKLVNRFPCCHDGYVLTKSKINPYCVRQDPPENHTLTFDSLSRRMVVEWNTPANLQDFDSTFRVVIRWSNSLMSNSEKVTLSHGSSSYILNTTIYPSTSYGVELYLTSQNGRSELTYSKLRTPDPDICPPLDVHIENLGISQAKLTWKSNPDRWCSQVVNYTVLIVEGASHLEKNGQVSQVNLKESFLRMKHLKPNVTYTVAVYAKNTRGNSSTKILTFTTKMNHNPVSFGVKLKINSIFEERLKDSKSHEFRGLKLEIEKSINRISSQSIYHAGFLGYQVLNFRRGSVIVNGIIRFLSGSPPSENDILDLFQKENNISRYLINNSSVNITAFDECIYPEYNDCHEYAYCIDSLNSFYCECMEAFDGNGTDCDVPPRIVNKTRNATVDVLQTFKLQCIAAGSPRPDVTWYKDGIEIGSSKKDSGRKSHLGVLQNLTLVIQQFVPEDQGLYTCNATNIHGMDVYSLVLSVKPVLLKVLLKIEVVNESFVDAFHNKSSKKYQSFARNLIEEISDTYKDSQEFERVEVSQIRPGNDSILVMFTVTFKVTNRSPEKISDVVRPLSKQAETGKIGKFQVKSRITIRELPSPPINLRIRSLSSNSLAISWQHPEFKDAYEIRTYIIQERKSKIKWKDLLNTSAEHTHYEIINLHPNSNYSFRIKSENSFGIGMPSEEIDAKTLDMSPSNHNSVTVYIVIGVVGLLILLVGGTVMIAWSVKSRNKKAMMENRVNMKNLGEKNDVDEVNYINDEAGKLKIFGIQWWEIPDDRLQINKILGSGQFGIVYSAILEQDDGKTSNCALKTLKDHATIVEKKSLIVELENLASIGTHPNIVNFLGACTNENLCLVIEFCENGDLLEYLRKNRVCTKTALNAEIRTSIELKRRMQISLDIAMGMAYLAEKRVIHRDLAARNILLDANMSAKVSDFGRARDVYESSIYMKKNAEMVPVRWMSLETLRDQVYTVESDIWSFGVLLWEIESGGVHPYNNMQGFEELFANIVRQGYRLERPPDCPEEMYKVMLHCWNNDPKERPTFAKLVSHFESQNEIC